MRSRSRNRELQRRRRDPPFLPFLRNVNIIISTVDSRRAREPTRLFFFASHRQGWKRVLAGLSLPLPPFLSFSVSHSLALPPLPLSSVRGKRFFPQFPRDCLLRKFSTPIDCPLLGQIIFIIFLGARPLAVRATLWPPRNEAAAQPLARGPAPARR